MLVVSFCVDRRNYVVIMSTEHCLSIGNHAIIGKRELFTSKLILTDYRFMRAKGCYDFFLCVL